MTGCAPSWSILRVQALCPGGEIPEIDGAAQAARDRSAAQRELQAGGVGSPWGAGAAQVGAAPGQRAGGGEDDDGAGASAAARVGRGEAHERGLRGDPPAADAAAPGDVCGYGACPPLSCRPAASPAGEGSAAGGGAGAGSGSPEGSAADGAGSVATGAPPPFWERSATLSLAIPASAWWVSRPQ